MGFFDLDIFSPSISLYYKENDKHSSTPSVIISFMAILFTIILTLYSSIQTIQRKNFSAYFYDRYEKNLPEVSFDKKGLYHYLILNTIIPNDKILTVIGYENYPAAYLSGTTYSSTSSQDYTYIYGKCSSDDMQGIDYIIEDKTTFLKYGIA